MLLRWTPPGIPAGSSPTLASLEVGLGPSGTHEPPEQALPALSPVPFPQAATSAGDGRGWVGGECLRLLRLCCQLGERVLLVLGFVWLDAIVRFPCFVVICPSLVNCRSELSAQMPICSH